VPTEAVRSPQSQLKQPSQLPLEEVSLLAAGARIMTIASAVEVQGSAEAGEIAMGGQVITAHGPLSPALGVPTGWSVGLDSEGTTMTTVLLP
jgi:hypothetical protein